LICTSECDIFDHCSIFFPHPLPFPGDLFQKVDKEAIMAAGIMFDNMLKKGCAEIPVAAVRP